MPAVSEYFSRLSTVQKRWYAIGLAVSVTIVVAGTIITSSSSARSAETYSVAQSIMQIAPGLEVTGKALARDLGLPLNVPKKKPLRSLGVSQNKLDSVTKHFQSHEPSNLTYFVYVSLVAFGLLYLVRLGRPDGSPISERSHWYNRAPYVVALVIATVLAGFVLGKSPNAMEAIVKVFKAMVGLYPSVWVKLLALAFFVGLAIVGNKLICGWACPFGAIQELVYSIPILRKIKRRKLPFLVTNSVRCALFLAALAILFGVFGGGKGYVLYHGLNPFNLFDMDIESLSIAIAVIVSIILAFVVYRPFCHLICPFGCVSWIVEKFSLARVRIDAAKCTNCGACVRACPSQAALERTQRKLLPADCFSCARCLNVCPEDAIHYGFAERHK